MHSRRCLTSGLGFAAYAEPRVLVHRELPKTPGLMTLALYHPLSCDGVVSSPRGRVRLDDRVVDSADAQPQELLLQQRELHLRVRRVREDRAILDLPRLRLRQVLHQQQRLVPVAARARCN